MELLSPAKDLETGIAAINAGADAVYIGARKFGARISAGNPLEDIKSLVEYAHKFRARIYVTLNTILYDSEIQEAEKLVWEIYEAGADGLIIQDMGILEMKLPPIELIASTQCHNYEIEKIKFLEKAGFKRVILARELSLDQIREIRKNTGMELEFFVHGALCVSFSGRCYFSQAVSNRSANRGDCLQPCRLPYSLIDGDGRVVSKEKHLLSLKDLNLSNNLEELIDAGITSFKIEGRLKDKDYVENVTYYYRQKLDEIINRRKDLQKYSQGTVSAGFEPDPDKTFNRSYTAHFLNGRPADNLSIDSPKSLGKYLGKVKDVSRAYFTLDNDIELSNGDGLCFFGKEGGLSGSNVNVFEDGKIYLNDMRGIEKGMDIYRNHDALFAKQMEAGPCQRRLRLDFVFKETGEGFSLAAKDEEGNEAVSELKTEKEEAKNKEMAVGSIRGQIAKLGNTDYVMGSLEIEMSRPFFIPLSKLNEMRREAVAAIFQKRQENYKRDVFSFEPNDAPFPEKELTYEYNISNKSAGAFYARHGVEEIEPAFEIDNGGEDRKIMSCKHCLRYYFGACNKGRNPEKLKEPLYLVNAKGQKFRLRFDCARCLMEIYRVD